VDTGDRRGSHFIEAGESWQPMAYRLWNEASHSVKRYREDHEVGGDLFA
jgi:hypothetical protein